MPVHACMLWHTRSCAQLAPACRQRGLLHCYAKISRTGTSSPLTPCYFPYITHRLSPCCAAVADIPLLALLHLQPLLLPPLRCCRRHNSDYLLFAKPQLHTSPRPAPVLPTLGPAAAGTHAGMQQPSSTASCQTPAPFQASMRQGCPGGGPALPVPCPSAATLSSHAALASAH